MVMLTMMVTVTLVTLVPPGLPLLLSLTWLLAMTLSQGEER